MEDLIQADASGPALSEKVNVPAEQAYWVIAAVAFDKGDAYILDLSPACAECDLIDGYAVSDSIDWSPPKDRAPGLYRLFLKPWSHSDYDGVVDAGVDVIREELLIEFSIPLAPNGRVNFSKESGSDGVSLNQASLPESKS
jgi:hypothetical protein